MCLVFGSCFVVSLARGSSSFPLLQGHPYTGNEYLIVLHIHEGGIHSIQLLNSLSNMYEKLEWKNIHFGLFIYLLCLSFLKRTILVGSCIRMYIVFQIIILLYLISFGKVLFWFVHLPDLSLTSHYIVTLGLTCISQACCLLRLHPSFVTWKRIRFQVLQESDLSPKTWYRKS